jgi:peptide/nickel transport system permease protein
VTLLGVTRRAGFVFLAILLCAGLLAHWVSRAAGVPAWDVSRLQAMLPRAGVRVLWAWWVLATRNVLAVAATASVLGVLSGSALGALSVYGSAGIGGALTRLLGFMGTVPALLLVGMLRLGDPTHGLLSLLAALTLLRCLEVAQLVRMEVLGTLLSGFVEASRALGGSRRWQLRWHVLPRVARPLLVNCLQGAGALIGLEAALSFVGLGLPSETPSWGGGLAAVATHGSSNAALLVTVLSIALSCGLLYGLGASYARGAEPMFPGLGATGFAGKPLGGAARRS